MVRASDLREILKTLGDRMTDAEIDEMMLEADIKDGMINIHGNISCLSSKLHKRNSSDVPSSYLWYAYICTTFTTGLPSRSCAIYITSSR
jgi:hypothetical protein